MSKKLLSLVVPVYFEEECVQKFIDETSRVLKNENQPYEIVFIDDGSQDKTCEIIKNNFVSHPQLRLIEFSYNHGKQAAVSAGIAHAKGDYLLYMDPDLQDPPDEIPRFIEKIEEGYNLVFGVRKEKKDSFVNRMFSKIFWGTLQRFTGMNLPKGLAVMRIFDRSFADEFLRYGEQNRFIEGIFMRIQKHYTTIEIEQRERFAGTTKFNFKKKMKLAFDAIFDFSEIPLKATIRVGMFLMICGFFALIGIVLAKLFLVDFAAGWPSTIGAIILGFGIQLFFMGVLAKYIGKIYKESKNRPLYSIKKLNNFE